MKVRDTGGTGSDRTVAEGAGLRNVRWVRRSRSVSYLGEAAAQINLFDMQTQRRSSIDLGALDTIDRPSDRAVTVTRSLGAMMHAFAGPSREKIRRISRARAFERAGHTRLIENTRI